MRCFIGEGYTGIDNSIGVKISKDRINLEYESKGTETLANKLIQTRKSSLIKDWIIYNPQELSQKAFKKLLKNLSNSSFTFLEIWWDIEDQRLKLSPFIPDLWRVMPKCYSLILLEQWIISQRDLQHIFNNAITWIDLKLSCCYLDFEDITITTQIKSRMEVIDFYECGRMSQWDSSSHKFKNLMKAISNSPIRKSLKQLYIAYCEVSKEEWQAILQSLWMPNIEILL